MSKTKFIESARALFQLRNLTYCALLVALYVVLNVMTPPIGSLKFTFSFVAFALLGMVLGPVSGALACGAADILSYVIRPTGAFHPGFTLTAILTGMVFGLFLYQTRMSLWRVVLSRAIVNIVLNIGLNTLWLTTLMSKGYLVLLPGRIWKNLALLPFEIFAIFLFAKLMSELLHRTHAK